MMGWLAEDVMTRNVFCVYSDLDVRDLAKLFLERHITGAPVCSEDHRLIGVVSQTDLLQYVVTHDNELVMDSDFYGTARLEGRYLPRGFQILDTTSGTVGECMTPVLHTVQETTSVEDVARLMRKEHIHRVIVEREGRVRGLISALDLITVLTSATHPPPGRAAKKTKKK